MTTPSAELNGKKQSTRKTENVPFENLKNYFVKNTEVSTEKIQTKKISSKEEFDKTFGAAPVMGKNGKPTVINFDREIVLAVYSSPTHTKTELKATKLEYGDNHLTLYYSVTESGQQNFTVKPLLLLAVDKKYDGFTKFKQQK